MKTVEGYLITLALQCQFDVIVHGCNCFCTMGAGIARAIQEEFPEAYAADLVTIKGDRNKLEKTTPCSFRCHDSFLPGYFARGSLASSTR